MTPNHTIRLHAAWKRMVAEPAGSAVESLTVSLPDARLAECAAPEVIYRRNFNRPTGIGPQTVLLLVSDFLWLAHSAQLNGHPLAVADSGQAEITALLLAHNELEIVLQRDAFLAGSQATAAIQIVEPA